MSLFDSNINVVEFDHLNDFLLYYETIKIIVLGYQTSTIKNIVNYDQLCLISLIIFKFSIGWCCSYKCYSLTEDTYSPNMSGLRSGQTWLINDLLNYNWYSYNYLFFVMLTLIVFQLSVVFAWIQGLTCILINNYVHNSL